MAAKLRDFIAQVRAALDRGLPINATTVLDGLEVALDQRSRPDLPVRYDIGIEYVERRARRTHEYNKRFGQPHHGHREGA